MKKKQILNKQEKYLEKKKRGTIIQRNTKLKYLDKNNTKTKKGKP
jgi:hypothetical protein